MRLLKIAVSVVALTAGLACQNTGSTEGENPDISSGLPLGETEGRQFGESGVGGSGSTGALNVNQASPEAKPDLGTGDLYLPAVPDDDPSGQQPASEQGQ